MSSHEAGKGSKRRPKGLVTDQKLLDNWDRIFNSKPNDKQFTDHIERVKWRDEMVQEAHNNKIESKDD